jgi:hypothetical protein
LARAYLGKKDFEKAETFAHSAYQKAVGMKYRWAEGDTADLLGEIYSVRGDKANGRKWLKKAVGCRKEILDPKVKETGEIKKNQRLKCKNQNCGIPTTSGCFFERSLRSLRSVGMTVRREKVSRRS